MDERNQISSFPGKIMLFGEYSIMAGSSAVLIPYDKVRATLRKPFNKKNPASVWSNEQLGKFLAYLKNVDENSPLYGVFDLEHMEREIYEGLYMESSIPENYGLGSSGALCATVYRKFNKCPDIIPEITIVELRKIFAHMESFFHGTSSGVDPLCIYINEPLGIIRDEHILPGLNGLNSTNTVNAFLIDTGVKSSTIAYVREFKINMKDRKFRRDFRKSYIPLVNMAVVQWLKGKLEENVIFAISRWQQVLFRSMINHDFSEVWDKGIYTGMYALKLCGSGGGGMILGFTSSLPDTQDYLIRNYNITIEPVLLI